ncbi:hypothetical protein D0869_01479 [Hortaea werneckii]|uniref:Exonuclease domain-containing protein n=1 Tax=Hortaea werneckii TaxID=91943 RepID=A0A3M6ZFQ4_HORWE|nr:hypothetical protein KC324_g14568 [Hortaea werneckii]KAI7547231.1 hypothetical protein KC316_g14668 [Hortaea werneckii]RMX88628.1 hypothetical protein D0869_01479 [Hortaea werneckii]RMY14030.1 hypothetical protein D0868_01681 [Hortaea werneckii]
MPTLTSTYRNVQTITRDSVQWDNRNRPILPQPKPIQAQKTTRATTPIPRMDRITSTIAIDCEFQEAYVDDLEQCIHRAGRVSLVNYEGQPIYDVFAYYPEQPGYRKKLPPRRLRLGVYWDDLKPHNGACPIAEVEYTVQAILQKAAVVVGHAIHNDMRVFSPEVFDGVATRDTQLHESCREFACGRQRLPKLSVLAQVVLGWRIQGAKHSSVEDAAATVALYRKDEVLMEREQGGRGFEPDQMATESVPDGGWMDHDEVVYEHGLEEEEEEEEDDDLIAALQREPRLIELELAQAAKEAQTMALSKSAQIWQGFTAATRSNTSIL